MARRCLLSGVLLALCAGLLLAAAFPHLGWSPLAFVALVPVFQMVEAGQGKRRVLLPCASLGLFFLLLLYWIPRVMVVYGGLSWITSAGIYLLLCVSLALFYVPAIVGFLFVRPIGALLAHLFFPFAWITCDLIRSFWMVNGFPWGSLGYTQVNQLWAQIADIGGIYLVTFLVVAVNSAVAYAWLHRRRWGPAALSAVLLGGSATYGILRSRVVYSPPTLLVGIVQPVIEINASSAYLREKYLAEMPARIGELAAQGARLVVLPEAPSEFDYYRDSAFSAALRGAARQYRVALIFNNTTVQSAGRYYNSMIFLRPDGSEAGRYDKIHLVPFGEYVPWERILSFVQPLVQQVGGFSAGQGIVVADLGGVVVGGFICYEAIFPELIRGFAAAGAEVLVNITDDGWYGRSAAAAQHFQIARMRSIETRRFLIRAANTGISAVVDPAGRVKRQLDTFREGTLVAGIRPEQVLPFYVRRGNLFAQSCVWIFTAGLVVMRLWVGMRIPKPGRLQQ